jgi:hypothetical protein
MRSARAPTPTPWKSRAWALLGGSDGEPGVEYTWTDDARIMFTSGTTGRSKGVIKQNAADYFSARGLLGWSRPRQVGRVARQDTFFLLPLFHSTPRCSQAAALVADAGSPTSGFSRAGSAAGDRRRATIFNSIWWSATSSGTSPSDLDRAQGPHLLRRPAPKDIYNEFRSASGSSSSRARPHRDRHGDLHGPDQAGARLDGQANPDLRSRSWSPAPTGRCPRHAGRDRGRP